MLKTFVRNYPYIHLCLGLIGKTLFLIGSVLFLQRFSAWHHVAVVIFIVGSFGMLLGAVGKAVTDLDTIARNGRGKHRR